jgi:hypothetical protein
MSECTPACPANGRPLDDERGLVEQAFLLLAEAREGVDGFGAWPEADEMDGLLRVWRTRLDALLTAADAPVVARRERERRAAERAAGSA